VAFADDLLKDAYHLAHRGGKKPTQASLRRAVSNGYYALFHMLISEFVAKWRTPRQRTTLARIFLHGRMKNVSKRIADTNVRNPTTAESELRQVADAFVRLQQNRHAADYDNGQIWTRVDVVTELDLVTDTFKRWRGIRDEPTAQDYLMAMLEPRQSG
jgi:uncharacterized protein (UPF0332 family)